MSIQRRRGGTFQVTVCFGGRTVRRSSRHWTLADARKVERDLIAEIRDLAAGRKPERLISEALERFLLEHVPKLRSAPQTRNHARALMPHIRGRALREAPTVWAEIKASKAHLAPGTINHSGRILRQLCRMAQREWAWIDEPIGERIKLLRETPRELFLTLEEVEALAAASPRAASAELILMAAYTGVRRGQMLRIHGAKQVIDGWLHLDRNGKSAKPLVIPLHPRVRSIAERMPLPITNRMLRDDFEVARAAIGLPHARWHDLRHTCASWLVQAGVPLTTIRDLLGHSTIAVTQRYAHLAPAHLLDAVARLK